VVSPFVLRTFEPLAEEVEGKQVEKVTRLGKRIVLGLEGEMFVVIHLMIAGRLRWTEKVAKSAGRGGGKIGLASFEFESSGTMHLVEASKEKRAGIWIVRGAAIGPHDPHGDSVFAVSPARFVELLRSQNRTLKRFLTDPNVLDGIGNAYSDEILHAARLSPVTLTSRLSEEECGRLLSSAREVLSRWTAKLREELGDGFPGPGEVTAFRPDFAVHGKYGQPCPACGTAVQRIRYASNETNYCPRCQTGGKVLADRSLSRLLKKDWPGRVEEWE
jgi:formamidopyrimidine-DNA glycosylase